MPGYYLQIEQEYLIPAPNKSPLILFQSLWYYNIWSWSASLIRVISKCYTLNNIQKIVTMLHEYGYWLVDIIQCGWWLMCKTSINVFIYTTSDRRLVLFLSLFYSVSSTAKVACEVRIWNNVEGSSYSHFKVLSKKPIERPGNKGDNSSLMSAGFCT
jgi:hypothetical protein